MGTRLWLLGGALFASLLTTNTFAAAKVDQDVLDDMESNEVSTVIIHLDGQYDLKTLPATFDSREARIDYMVDKLKKFTNEKSTRLRTYLTDTAEGVQEVTPIWITNSLRVRAPGNVIREIMAMNGIERISLHAPKALDKLGESNGSLFADPEEETKISWGVEKVRAPELWERQIQGQGIKVAIIDTGINFTHPDLAPQMWQNPGESGLDDEGRDKGTNGVDDDGNGFIDDVMGYNFEAKNGDISDDGGHGSKVAGIVAGNGSKGIQTGVAPKATIVGIKSCCGSGTSIFESNTWEGMQYAILTKVRVISMSLSAKYYSNPTYDKWRRASEVMLQAGIVHINSAGNLGSGNTPKNVGAPASNPPAWLHPLQKLVGGLTAMITIGATDEDDKLRSYSSTGPVSWENIEGYGDYAYENGVKMGLTKPEVCGPSEVPSTSQFGEGYTNSFGGTSSATPNVAGVATLLLSARPDLTVEQVTETLMMSAVEVNAESKFDNKCGAGRVDAVAAVDYANAHFRKPTE
ncbi:MAG: S8 family serine peptidase [Bdellovibrionaceae bacterium]|nr:S8 family serine peptidase [Bdellovibrionales bacterium]MCB9253115.1 S8 family serine peptidase [Pseudobdellovibrionaceae bacterium]